MLNIATKLNIDGLTFGQVRRLAERMGIPLRELIKASLGLIDD